MTDTAARQTTPTAACAAGHTHVSAYAALLCDSNAAPMPASYDLLTDADARRLATR